LLAYAEDDKNGWNYFLGIKVETEKNKSYIKSTNRQSDEHVWIDRKIGRKTQQNIDAQRDKNDIER